MNFKIRGNRQKAEITSADELEMTPRPPAPPAPSRYEDDLAKTFDESSGDWVGGARSAAQRVVDLLRRETAEEIMNMILNDTSATGEANDQYAVLYAHMIRRRYLS